MHRLSLLVFIVLLVWVPPAHAQLPVIDAANFTQNLITAVQAVLIVFNQVLELTQGAVILGEGDFDGDLAMIGQLIEEAQGLSYDLGSLQAQVSALFSLEMAPPNTLVLAERLTEIRRVVFESRVYALRVQTLLQTTLRTVQRLSRLVSLISGFIGNMQGNQTMSQIESTITEQLAKIQVQSAAFERAETIDKLTEPLIQRSLELITIEVSADYPRAR